MPVEPLTFKSLESIKRFSKIDIICLNLLSVKPQIPVYKVQSYSEQDTEILTLSVSFIID